MIKVCSEDELNPRVRVDLGFHPPSTITTAWEKVTGMELLFNDFIREGYCSSGYSGYPGYNDNGIGSQHRQCSVLD